ncbi:hypothetical protein Zmor_017421 [Zophobas morio]|uniref:non-specific serine/threonine protein kinase n=1 Tax=Zophobas morio TaxID=2755281 RepID=A0AA38ICK2_9CUCU|nr:hypothetical protein Zmor_017421 [Zophobas morio]
MRIRELPYMAKRDVCKLLEINGCFHELGSVHMQFEDCFLQNILLRCKDSNTCPTEKLLNEWDTYGHTVLELFIVLNRMKQYKIMKLLKPYIDAKYHYLIKEVPTPPNVLSEKILNAPPQIPVISRDDNITTPQQNNLQKLKSPGLKANGASDVSSVMESAGAIPQIPYEELQKSTNNWDQANILGKGGFGMVFKGIWKCTQVAIKRIEKKEDSPESSYQQIVQSNTELHCLNAYRHDNILPLYGYSIGGPQPCLVYQFMSGGSLEDRLRVHDPSRVLPWPTRLTIATGTARGLQFLHTIRDKPLIHGDIKAANILLDQNDMPRIGDFGLAREGPASEYVKVTRIHGTRPYLPDEFMKYRKFSTKVDTYSFGVVLFELATGASAYSTKREHKFLRDHVVKCEEGRILELKDPRAPGGESYYRKIVNIGRGCVHSNAKNRPEMVNVLLMLEREN